MVDVERDPSVAVTRLLSGDADWILEVGPEFEDAVTGIEGVSAAPRPLDLQYGILFNVRPDRVYFDREARRAFSLCLDHEALATRLDRGRSVATTPYTASSWALPDAAPEPRDVAAATRVLDAAGWLPAEDGVRARDGRRLSSTIAVRPTSVDLFTFANEAAAQLAECGIELVVEELDLTGGTMLDQLLWPNDFDTLLLARQLGPDPDSAVRAFESSRITSEANQADANPSGFTSSLADHLISSARETLDPAQRAEAYAGVQDLLAQDVPYWPLWYDSAVSALSDAHPRRRRSRGPVPGALRLGRLELVAGPGRWLVHRPLRTQARSRPGPSTPEAGTFGPVAHEPPERPYTPSACGPFVGAVHLRARREGSGCRREIRFDRRHPGDDAP